MLVEVLGNKKSQYISLGKKNNTITQTFRKTRWECCSILMFLECGSILLAHIAPPIDEIANFNSPIIVYTYLLDVLV